MPATKRPFNAFGLQTVIKLNTFGISQAKLAEVMGVKPSNLCEAMHKENASALFISKWTKRADKAFKILGGN